MASEPDLISASTLAALIESGTAPAILDVRSRAEFVSGRVPGAIHIPFWTLWFRAAELSSSLREGPLVVYCGHGPRARIAVAILRRRRFQQLTCLEGHMSRWRRAGLPEQSGASAGSRGPGQPVPELERYRRQLRDITCRTEALLEGLTERELSWREARTAWSVADCLNHLVVTGRQSLSSIRNAILDGRCRGWLAAHPVRHPLLGNWFVRLMDAPPRIRFKAPRAYRPVATMSVAKIVEAFFLLQRELIEAADEAAGVDLARVKVSNPVSRWCRMSLGQEFALTAAHERRHLWQAARVLEKLRATEATVRTGENASA